MSIRCLNCMKLFPGEGLDAVCPHCGYKQDAPASEAFMLQPGVILNGRYAIGTSLGFGGFGITYRAWDNSLDTLVCIKEYYPSGLVQRTPGEKEVILAVTSRKTEYETGLNRFLEEARNMAKFAENKNIVHVANYFEENGTAYIVMEFLDGISLKEYLKMEGGSIDPETAVLIISEVIEGLRDVHKAGILHRDISPDNIFICDGNRIKLIDFGAARFSDEEKEITRSIILKPGFAPPEQYQSKSKQGPFTDIYALSATLYRMVTGVLPEDSTSRTEKDKVVPPKDIAPAVDENLSNAIMRGMALNPAFRFRNVDEMKAAIKGEAKVADVEAEIKRRKKKRLAGILISVLVIVLGIGVALGVRKKANEKNHLKAADVVIWLSYGIDSDEASTKKMMEDMLKDFFDDYEKDGVKAEIVCIPEEDYEAKLYEAYENGNLPVLFMADLAPETVLKEAASLDKVFDYIKTEDYYFLKDSKENCSYNKYNLLPLGFKVPVLYARRSEELDINNIDFNSIDLLTAENSKGFYVFDKDRTMSIQTMLSGPGNPPFSKAYPEETKRLSAINSDEAALTAFAEGSI
ncbi:MAG: protein kinase, partial [Lachnospiraceae bacterium]|nr:protein kinase [Lachnospiraceae bacterium]